MPHPTRTIAAVALVWAASAGCAVAGPNAEAASTVVTSFTSALRSDDGARACELLAPATRDSLEEQSGDRCDEAIVGLGLPTTETGSEPRSYGRQAQVRTADDVLFLTRSGDTWLITAAGCAPRRDRPYDCDLAAS
ncbi:MAG TPA: hypothetical protein VNR62_03260 [Cellulomonas sp.]|nr:hypothetical protein [Cellulomonas sp.]